MCPMRVYVDTSVIGGCLDDEFARESLAVLQMARDGEIILLFSDILADELAAAPPEVQEILADLPASCFERVASNPESRQLRDAYLKARVVGPQRSGDAHHISLATIGRADVVVSWNFRHIVNYQKTRLFNAVNLREGYPTIDIRSPLEMAR